MQFYIVLFYVDYNNEDKAPCILIQKSIAYSDHIYSGVNQFLCVTYSFAYITSYHMRQFCLCSYVLSMNSQTMKLWSVPITGTLVCLLVRS